MPKEFYLSSHDFGSDSRPRRCELVQEVTGSRPNSDYLLVRVEPPLWTRFRDGPRTEFRSIILSIIGRETIRDIGKKPVSVEVVLCPMYSGGVVDETRCSKIGTGGLHATYNEASRDSPAETR